MVRLFPASNQRFPFEVRYVDRRAEEHLWSHHRSVRAAKRVLREPRNQLDIVGDAYIIDIRSGSVPQ